MKKDSGLFLLRKVTKRKEILFAEVESTIIPLPLARLIKSGVAPLLNS